MVFSIHLTHWMAKLDPTIPIYQFGVEIDQAIP